MTGALWSPCRALVPRPSCGKPAQLLGFYVCFLSLWTVSAPGILPSRHDFVPLTPGVRSGQFQGTAFTFSCLDVTTAMFAPGLWLQCSAAALPPAVVVFPGVATAEWLVTLSEDSLPPHGPVSGASWRQQGGARQESGKHRLHLPFGGGTSSWQAERGNKANLSEQGVFLLCLHRSWP